MYIVRSVMLHAVIGVSLSDILYPGTFDENSCIVCALLPLLYTPAVTLYADYVYVHYIDRHVRFVLSLRPHQYFDENLSSDVI